MKIFIIPSWYPSEDYPSTGIFFKEQSRLIAINRPTWKVGICLWGSHDPDLWVRWWQPFKAISKLFFKKKNSTDDAELTANCTAFFTPAPTWTRRWKQGNIQGITAACEQNLNRYIASFGKPDIIHAHVAYPGGMIAWRLSEKYQIPVVISEHQSPFPMPSFRKDFSQFILPSLQAAHRVLAVSQALVTRLAHFGVKSEMAGNFIDDEFFAPGNDYAEVKKLVVVGRLEPQKNYHTLLDALKLLKDRGMQYEMSIVGSGNQEQSLKKEADALGLTSVRWLGECTQTEVRDLLRAASLFINCSLHENQPVAILEAMACGVPVLCFDWAGADELVKPGLGKVIPSNAKNLAETIFEFEFPERVVVRATYEQLFGSARQIDNLEKIYREVITEGFSPR